MSLWADSGNRRATFGPLRKGRGHLEAVEQVKDWTRDRFALADSEVVLVSELSSSVPGYPPVETVISFWTADGTAHHFKVFKRVEDVVNDDVPPAWLKESLARSEGVECACC